MIKYYVTCCSLFILMTFSAAALLPPSAIMINEVMSSNKVTLADEDGDSPDWIELHNPHDTEVSLENCGLSDEEAKPFKWVFPNVRIQPRGFLLVFASDKDRRPADAPLHLNFKIKSSSESLFLTGADSVCWDIVEAPPLQTDLSWGRLPDGSESWDLFSSPTPGKPNDPNFVQPAVAPPQFSAPAGFYNGPLSITLSAVQKNVQIFYTTDGSLPDSLSFLYTTPIQLDTTTALRARALRPGCEPGPVISATFLINEQVHFPVVSLTTEPKNLWDLDYGIYNKGRSYQVNYPYKGANFWREWERPVYIEFFEPNGALGFAENAGLRIFGHWSVGAPFKPLVLYARKSYGVGKFRCRIFPDKSIDEFEAFMLRNSGNDWSRTLFRDAVIHSIAGEIGLPTQAYRPAIVFLNGVYWGIHNLRERLNEHYIASNFGVDADEIDLVAENYGFQVYAGDSLHYIELRDYIHTHDLSRDEYYEHAASFIDIQNFIDYFIIEIYFANRDWPHNNLHLWRPRRDDGQWMWLIKDMDHCFGYATSIGVNTLRINAMKDQFFPYLVQNKDFQNRFLNRFAYLMNTLLQPDHVIRHLDEKKEMLLPEIERHLSRWAGAETYDNPPQNIAEWQVYVDELYQFARTRMPFVRKNLIDQFKLGGMARLSLSIADSSTGAIYVEGERPHLPFNGDFFKDVPLNIRAVASPGYRFDGWQGAESLSDSLTLLLTDDLHLNAQFSPVIDPRGLVVINEINYQSSARYPVCDWIELTSLCDQPLDLSNWYFTKQNNQPLFTFPEKTLLPANGFLTAVGESKLFRRFFPLTRSVDGDFSGDLANHGDCLRLYDADGRLVDKVAYSPSPPWPAKANGADATLALIHPAADNSMAANWFASELLGTPGEANIRVLPVEIQQLVAKLNDHSKTVDLRWQCSSLVSPLFFDVQKQREQEWFSIAAGDSIILQPDGWYTFPDNLAESGVVTQYRVLIADDDEQELPVNVKADTEVMPPFERFLTSFPNPFNQSTTFFFSLTEANQVTLELFDLNGRKIITLVDAPMNVGRHHIRWDGGSLASGLYFCRLSCGAQRSFLKVLIQK